MRLSLALFVGVLTLSLMARAAVAAPPLETYGKLPTVESIELSPDGKRIAFVGSIGGQRTLTVREIGGPVLASSPVGSLKMRGVDWVGNDIVLVSNTSTFNWGVLSGGQNVELLEIVSIDLVGKKSFPVMQKAKTLGSVFGQYGARQINGRWYGYFGGYETSKDDNGNPQIVGEGRNLYRIDLLTGEPLLIAQGRDDSDDWQVGADGKLVARAAYLRGSGTWKMYVGDNVTPSLSREDKFNRSSLIGIGRTPGTVLISPVEAEDGDYIELATTPGAQPQTLPIPNHLRRLWFDRQTHQLIGFTSGVDHREVTMFDPKSQARIRGAIKAFPNYRATVQSWSDDFGRMIVLTEGGDDPGTYWLIDIGTGKASQLGSTYPLEGKDVGLVKMIDYKAADGTAMQGVLTLPPGKEAKNLPIVVLPHGGPAARDEPVFDWWAQAFASRGYAVFQPNFRGSVGYGQAFRDAGFGEWGRKMQTDISDGVKALADQGIVDPKRACIVGGSYGGYAALAGVTVQQGLYKCAVSYAGITDLKLFLQDYKEINDPSSRYIKSYLGAKGTGDPVLQQISPIALKDKVDAPVLLIHGKDDTVVPIRQSEVFERELKRAGKSVELIKLDGEDHWLSREPTRTAMLKAAVAFVEKHNPAN
jgi:dienelactone hydrolase